MPSILKWLKELADDYWLRKDDFYIKQVIPFYKDDGRIIHLRFELCSDAPLKPSAISGHGMIDIEIEDPGCSDRMFVTHITTIEREILYEYIAKGMHVRKIMREIRRLSKFMTFESMSDHFHDLQKHRGYYGDDDGAQWR